MYSANVQIPPGCSRYTVDLTRPLGLTLEEDGKGGIRVADVARGGNAERAELISEGDALISTSAIVFTRESEYQGNMVRSGEQQVTLNVQGEVRRTHRASALPVPGDPLMSAAPRRVVSISISAIW